MRRLSWRRPPAKVWWIGAALTAVAAGPWVLGAYLWYALYALGRFGVVVDLLFPRVE